jgi:hypothetical protein
MTIKSHIILLFIFVGIFCSCDFDQVEYTFEDYTSANNSGLFDTKWIPEEVISENMSEIYLRTNLDLNICFFSFQTSNEKIDSVLKLLGSTKKILIKPRRLRVSKKFLKQTDELDFFLLNQVDLRDTVYVAIDKPHKMILGLRI